MADGFCMVKRKKWIARRNLQPRHRKLTEKSDVDGEVDVDKFIKRLELVCEQMNTSDYFTQAVAALEISLQQLQPGMALQRVVCFGIGPFTRTFHALHQLAFILSAQRHFGITEAIYYDPVFREVEKQILQQLQCNVMKENCEGKYLVDQPTLFYLPHCSKGLTNNLLWSNWSPKNLPSIVLISNSFESITNSVTASEAGYILQVYKYTKEVPLEDDYEVQHVFNDLSVHIFPLNILPDINANFWESRESPTYKDDEIIFAEKFDKLSIS